VNNYSKKVKVLILTEQK